MSWLRTPKQVFFVRSGEQNPCPFCDGLLKVIGSRHRGYIDGLGDRKVLMIRRLRCLPCDKIHHELPDLLVPYKRHESKSIEAAVSGDATLTVAADESTIIRWKQWFSDLAGHFAGALFSIAIRYGIKAAEEACPGSLAGRLMLRNCTVLLCNATMSAVCFTTYAFKSRPLHIKKTRHKSGLAVD